MQAGIEVRQGAAPERSKAMVLDEGSRPGWVDSDAFPFESRWIDLDRHRIHYVDEGPRDATVLLFVHPAGGWSFTYRYQIRSLRDAFRCVAPDLPGFGLSEAADGFGYTLREQSRVVERFVQALDLSDIVVWANDGGGPTAVLGLAGQADRVRGLVVGGTFGWSLEAYPSVGRMIRIFSGRGFRAINRYTNTFARLMGSLALGTRTLSPAERRQYCGPFVNRASRDRPLTLIRSFLDPSTEEALDRSLAAFRDKPVLVQFGTRDPMTRQGWPDRWAKELSDATVRMLRGVRHFPFEDAPEATVANFRIWWAEINASGASQGDGAAVPTLEQVA